METRHNSQLEEKYFKKPITIDRIYDLKLQKKEIFYKRSKNLLEKKKNIITLRFVLIVYVKNFNFIEIEKLGLLLTFAALTAVEKLKLVLAVNFKFR